MMHRMQFCPFAGLWREYAVDHATWRAGSSSPAWPWA
jgi:hypothetical protein